MLKISASLACLDERTAQPAFEAFRDHNLQKEILDGKLEKADRLEKVGTVVPVCFGEHFHFGGDLGCIIAFCQRKLVCSRASGRAQGEIGEARQVGERQPQGLQGTVHKWRFQSDPLPSCFILTTLCM